MSMPFSFATYCLAAAVVASTPTEATKKKSPSLAERLAAGSQLSRRVNPNLRNLTRQKTAKRLTGVGAYATHGKAAPAEAKKGKVGTKSSKLRKRTTAQKGAAGYRAQPAKKKAKKRGKAKVKVTGAAAVANLVQSFYENTDDLSADFIQLYTRKAYARTSESRGTMKLKKPGMMRWDYNKPDIKHFIADGKKLYIYEPEEEQVIINSNFSASQLTSSVSFLWGQGKLTDSFTLAMGDAKAHKVAAGQSVLELTPKRDATYTKLILVVNAKTGQVMESKLLETSGNTNHFKFKNLKGNVGFGPKEFTFTPPPNVEVIEH